MLNMQDLKDYIRGFLYNFIVQMLRIYVRCFSVCKKERRENSAQHSCKLYSNADLQEKNVIGATAALAP